MTKIKSETKFLWNLIVHTILTPVTILLYLIGKREFKDIYRPLTDIKEFVFDAGFTISIILLTVLISCIGWLLLPDATFGALMNHPQDILNYERYYALITCGFIHGSIPHLFGNMLALFIFGRVVERSLGTKKTAYIYFGALLISSVGDSLIRLFIFNSNVPALGASGALMGLVATAMLLEPYYITYKIMIPVPIIVYGWLAIYADISGILSFAKDGIGHFAHLLGFFSITLLLYFMEPYNKEKMKKGFYINIASLIVFGLFIFYFGIG